MIQYANSLSPEIKIFKPKRFEDNRGYFQETFSQKDIQLHLGTNDLFVQENESYTRHANTIRGIHFQNRPMDHAKIVRCTQGAINDYLVDLRKSSASYKKWLKILLCPENNLNILVPRGFGHAFISLTDNVVVQYKISQYYSPEYDRAIRWDDPEINITWPSRTPILSDKDAIAPLLKESDCNF